MTADQNDASVRRTLDETNHTDPYTGRPFGDTQTYRRGKTVAADGGDPNADAGTAGTLADVSHVPPEETPGAQRAYDRGVRHE